MELTTINLDSADPRALGAFYGAMLGWPTSVFEPEWVVIRPPGGGVGLCFQLEENFVRPVWPSTRTDQQMMVHLEIRVDDLDGAVRHALSCGAELADFQPQDDVRVCLDPAGHPFCLWLGTA